VHVFFLPFKLLTKIGGIVSFSIVAFVLILFAWFFPWVFILPVGILIYFPYEPNGAERYTRVVGPMTNWLPSTSDSPWTETIPESCKKALIAAEDGKFMEHQGIDWEATQAALEKQFGQNNSQGKNETKKEMKRGKMQIKGGSTITQQIVKNAFLSRDVSIIRKGREISGALLLNLILQKEQQIYWYFNIVEFGPKTYGIFNAAKYYFSLKPEQLSQKQCAELVAILPSPVKWGKSLKANNPTSFLQRRTNTILARIGGEIKKPFEPWIDERDAPLTHETNETIQTETIEELDSEKKPEETEERSLREDYSPTILEPESTE
jgi:monofunctional glycosyltransferase